jgi:short-subunit dehydrogenase
MDLELKGKVAVITGASIGIGLAISEGLAAEGVNLVMVARQKDRLATEAARIADRFGVKSIGVSSDVATAGGIAEVVAATQSSFGGADLLINNAGTGSNETVM